jgi:aminoglycoside phosphotransferase (APT) family kinase protein
VLRVAVGPGRSKLHRQRQALEELRAADPPAALTALLPWPLHAGRTGLADWSLDTRLRGEAPSAKLVPRLLEDCIDFLVMLHGAQNAAGASESLTDHAEVLASVCASDRDAEGVRDLGRRLDETLADVPRGFGHGDFWTRNLLSSGDRLTGVVDWDGAGPGRLPLLDLLHLRLSAQREQTRQYLGQALVDHLLPWARSGGDEIVRRYGRRIGVELDRELLESLVAAYWLDRVASEVAMFADLATRPLWVRTNVHEVIRALARGQHQTA